MKQGNLISKNIDRLWCATNDMTEDPYIYDISKWKGILKGIPAFILGNGPSIENENLDLLNDFFTIGCSRICLRCEPTILMWQDVEVWKDVNADIMKSNSIKVSREGQYPGNVAVRFVIKENGIGISKIPWLLNGYMNNGILAVQLAFALGCSPIVLLGMDSCQKQLIWLKDHCQLIISCSDNNVWPREKFEDVINKFKDFEYGKEYYTNMLRKIKYEK